MASCIQIKSLIQAHIDDELTGSEKLLFEEHLRGCEACMHDMKEARAVTLRMFESLGQDRLRDDFTPQIMAHLPEMEASRQFPALARATGQEHKKNAWFRTVSKLVPVLVPIILLVLAGVLWVNWPEPVSNAAAVTGLVTFSKGPAQAGHISTRDFNPVHAKDVLVAGSLLKTDAGGRLLFGLMGPSHAALYENSFLHIVNDRELFLEQGSIFLDVHRESRQFSIDTRDGTITVMGTSFQVDAGPAGTQVTVVNGQVLVENEKSFALLGRGSQALFKKAGDPEIRKGVKANTYLEQARSVLPDPEAERHFLTRFVSKPPESAEVRKQIFMVDTEQRSVSELELNWLPDPYAEGHAGYHVYVSDSALNPLFKAEIAPGLFQDKSQSSLRIAVPPELREQAVSMLHITLMPDYKSGQLETSFTEVSAIGTRL